MINDKYSSIIHNILVERETNTLSSSSDVGVSMVGIHYSQGVRTTLSGDKYGSGIRGAEARRLAETGDKRILKRVYFYKQIEPNTYPKREGGLGVYVHETNLTNIFDDSVATESEYSNIKDVVNKYIQKKGEPQSNAFELALLDLGYNGYVSNQSGAIVVLGKDHVPTEYIGTVQELESK